MDINKLLEDYGCLTFSDDVMKERIPKSVYKAFHESLDKGEPLVKETATVIANAMKIWAVEHGATHFMFALSLHLARSHVYPHLGFRAAFCPL